MLVIMFFNTSWPEHGDTLLHVGHTHANALAQVISLVGWPKLVNSASSASKQRE